MSGTKKARPSRVRVPLGAQIGVVALLFLAALGPAAGGTAPPRPGQGPPPKEFDLIETQADAAIRKRQAAYVVEVVPPSTVAIRTAPVFDRPDGRVVAATWTMIRLVDPD